MGLTAFVEGGSAKYDAPYSAFMRFRRAVASAIGLDLEKMAGFGGQEQRPFPDHPLTPFLSHSDCDGHISPDDAAKMESPLRALGALFVDARHACDCITWADLCRESVDLHKPITFV